jgi:transposase
MLGIDVSKASLTCTLLDPQSHVRRWEKTVPNSAAGIAQLLAQTPPEVAWVLEPTGRYSRPVAQQAQAAGRRVLLAPPRQAHHFLQSLPARAKTDRLDSYGLGLFALAVALAPYPIPSPAVDRLQQLLTARRGLTKSLVSLQQQYNDLPHAQTVLKPAIAELKKQQAALDRQIAACQGEFPAMARLQKVPGIGPVTAAQVAARLTQSDFSHPDQFVSFIGLDVRVRQSGQREGRQGLSKQGDAELRRLFYLCALATVRRPDSPFRPQYERELQKGLPKPGALCAVARKLARLCWSLVKHGSDYDPERIYRHPSQTPSGEGENTA